MFGLRHTLVIVSRKDRPRSSHTRTTESGHLMVGFPEQPGHKGITAWIVLLPVQLAHDLSLRFLFSTSESEFEEHGRAALLSGLLVQDVLEQVFVSLDQSLRIDLAVLHLLFPISLNPLEQRLQSECLLSAQCGFFLLYSLV